MPSAVPTGPASPGVPARERRFYLEQFTGRTLVIARAAGSPADVAPHAEPVDALVADLVAEGVRVVLVQPGGRVAHLQPDDAGVVAVWRQLRRHGRMRIALPDDHDILRTAVRLAARLRAFKLVLVSPTAVRPTPESRPASFVSLDAAHADGEGLAALAAEALAGGVATVNVCHPADIAEELLTYAGAGTCYTLGDYCRVERVGIDDYDGVADLIAHGVEEGYLKPREPDAVAQLIVNGYGARVGDHHLAGFAALLTEPYAREGLGEVCALTTISRFAGEGVGSQIVDAMLRDAADRGLAGVFACTTAEPAARFFRRLGFVEVPQAELPAAKWDGYEPDRRTSLRCFLHQLVMLG
ncbi:GNAT family N-acetyltransferase [Euzebya sp.]|uniref:GNAT family N-acetyltransferase n=1 Tax=Euzebya sp. TaxID=1971409 RepID=UPI0035110586